MASTSSSVRTSEPRLIRKRAGRPVTDPSIHKKKKTNVKLEAIVILEIERSYLRWNSDRPEEHKWMGVCKQLTTQDKQKVWKILPINCTGTIILDNLPEPNFSSNLQQAIRDITYKENEGCSHWEVKNRLQASVQMRRFKYGFLKLFSYAAGKEAVAALLEDLLGFYNSPAPIYEAPIYEVRNIGGNSRSDDNAHRIGFQFLEIDSTSEDGQTPSSPQDSSDEDFKFDPPSNASACPTGYNFPDIVDKHTFVPDGTCKLIDGNMLLIVSLKSGFGDISERSKTKLFYECCTDLTKQKELAGLILNAQQAVLFHFLRDDTESTIVTRMNTYDFTGPETNNLEKLCKNILKLITRVEQQLE